MRIGAQIGREAGWQLSKNAPLPTRQRAFILAKWRRANAENWVDSQVIDSLKDRLFVDVFDCVFRFDEREDVIG